MEILAPPALQHLACEHIYIYMLTPPPKDQPFSVPKFQNSKKNPVNFFGNSKIPKFRNSKIPKFQNSKIPKFQNSKKIQSIFWKFQNSKRELTIGIPKNCLDFFGILDFWNFGISEFWNFGISKKLTGFFWNFGILEFWNFGILEFWNFGILEFRNF